MGSCRNERSDQQQEEEELFLDTKGACFLCLKEPSSDKSKSGGATTKVCLRDICRYLKIDPCSVLLTSLKEIIGNEEASILTWEKRDFSVLLCDACSLQTDQLKDLIRRMEVVKMLQRYQLQELEKTLMISGGEEESNCRWKKVKEKMISGCFNPVDARLVENLRTSAKEKCSAKINKLGGTSLSEICLEKSLGDERLQETMPTTSEDVEDSCEAIPMTSTVSSELVADTVLKIVEIRSGETPTPSCSISQKSPDRTSAISKLPVIAQQTTRILRSAKSNKLGGTSLSEMGVDKLPGEEQIHETMLTTSEDVPNSREAISTTSTNSSELDHILEIAEIRSEETPRAISPSCFTSSQSADRMESVATNPSLELPVTTPQTILVLSEFAKGCHKYVSIAPKPFSSGPIADHTGAVDAVENENETHQQNTVTASCSTSRQSDDGIKSATGNPALESFAKNYTKLSPGNKFECLNCPIVCSKEPDIRGHLLNYHPERILESLKFPLVPEEAFHKHCKSMFLWETKESLKEANKFIIAEGVNRCFCSCCKQYFKTKKGFQYHLVKDHYSWCKLKLDRRQQSFLRKRENNIQPTDKSEWNKCTISDGGCGQIFATSLDAARHRKEQCPVICNPTNGGCGKQFRSKSGLYKHKNNSCPKTEIKRSVECKVADGGCGRNFCTFSNLSVHIRDKKCLARGAQNWLLCTNADKGCTRKCTSQATLQNHLLRRCKFRKLKKSWRSWRSSPRGVENNSSGSTNETTTGHIEHVALGPQLEVMEETDQSPHERQCQNESNGQCEMETENSCIVGGSLRSTCEEAYGNHQSSESTNCSDLQTVDDDLFECKFEISTI